MKSDTKTSQTPTVSVVVPNYNHARFLRERLDTILAQTYQDFELILLDDCSTDESRDILRKYATDPHVSQIVFNEANSGSTFKQWNKGVRLARGKYVWIAESDDYADPRLLQALVSRLDEDPSAVLAQCRTRRVSAEGTLAGFEDEFCSANRGASLWTKDFRADGTELCRRNLRCLAVQNASSIVFRADVYWRVGGADERLQQCADRKTWTAMALAGGTICYTAEPLNYRRHHEASVTERNLKDLSNGVLASEALYVTAWTLERVRPDRDALDQVRGEMSAFWLPAVVDKRTPADVRRSILRSAESIDPQFARRVFYKRLRAEAIRIYYRLMDVTYASRRVIGLHRKRMANPSGESEGHA